MVVEGRRGGCDPGSRRRETSFAFYLMADKLPTCLNWPQNTHYCKQSRPALHLKEPTLVVKCCWLQVAGAQSVKVNKGGDGVGGLSDRCNQLDKSIHQNVFALVQECSSQGGECWLLLYSCDVEVARVWARQRYLTWGYQLQAAFFSCLKNQSRNLVYSIYQ